VIESDPIYALGGEMKRQSASLVFFLCLVATLSFGQEFRATIGGHVIDASSAAVAGAKLEATNLATSEVTTATTDSSGAYTIPFLRPGKYKLTASAAGFKTYVKDNLVLEVGKVAGIDIGLEVGSVAESIEVSAEAVLLETQTASRGGVVTTQQVAEMPLNARNPFMLGTMMPGVTFRGAAIWQRPFDNGAIAQWSVNGSRDSSTEFMLDGASNNGQMGGNNIAYVPVVDAVQEFQMQMNLYNAEYGHTGGGIMNVVLKSGTNTFHATGWEFMRRTPLDANTFQNNAIGAPRPNHYLDQYGGQVEGPVYIPKLLKKDGAIKLFYLGTLENYREGTPNPLFVSWPEQEMRNGDFSKLYNAQRQPITIYDPLNYTLVNGDPVRQPFAGNIIPASRIHPVAAAVTKFMPLPNRQAPAGNAYSSNNLAIPNYFDVDHFYNLILKFDWNFGNRHRAFFRHASNDRTEDRSVNGIDNKPGTDGQQPFQRINDAYVGDWVYTATPTLILNARGSFNRFIEKGFGRANEGFDVSQLGISKNLLSQLPSPIYFGRWNFSGYNSLGRSQSNNFTNTYQFSFNVTKISGKHSMKGGFDMRQVNYLLQNTGDILSFSGNRGFTQRIWNQGDSVSGDGYATFLLGYADGSSNYPLFPWWQNYYMAPYFQDDWKVTRRLTLNLGLRLDLNVPAHEKHNRMNGPFDATVKNALGSASSVNCPACADLKGSLTFAGVGNIPSRPGNLNKNNWQPRAGFAYQINSRLVMRGGVGLYYSNPPNDNYQTAGFSTSTTLVNSLDGGRTPIPDVLTNPYSTGILRPTGSSAGTLTFVGRNNNWFDSNFKTPRVWSFSYGFQYEVTPSSVLELTYVGSRSQNLSSEKAFNIPSLAYRKTCNALEGGSPVFCNQGVPNPFLNNPAFLGTTYYSSTTISRFNLSRPFPQFSGDLLQQGRNDSNIWYNSVQVTYNLRMRGGLTILTNYNFSKELEKWGYNDPYNNVQQQGLYLNDRPHVFKFSSIYELPFGQGKRWGAGSNAFAKKLMSGWQLVGFFTDQSGEPSNLPGNVLILKDPTTPGGGWNGSPDWKAYQPRAWSPCVLRQFDDGHIEPQSYSLQRGCGNDFSNYPWLQTAAFAPRFTPQRSGQIRRHHAFTMDASVSKMTQITERLRVQFGFEAFNLANHNFFGRDQFNGDPSNPLFGTITPSIVSTQNILPRQIQVRMKAMW
jgi:hypothetical protein